MKAKALLALIPLGGIGAASVALPMFFSAFTSTNLADLVAGTGCTVALDPPPDVTGITVDNLTQEQLGNAATIFQVAQTVFLKDGRDRVLRAGVVGIATAMQESNLKNINFGDRDSLGLFQQRRPWGSDVDRTTPKVSATMFFTGGHGGQRGLDDISGWWMMPVTEAAQAVQVSASPNAYAQWEQLATDVVTKISGKATSPIPISLDPCGGQPGDPGTTVPVSGDVGKMLGFAKSLLGTPYVYGGTTYPPGVDCSGLLVYSWKKAGHPLRIRTSQQMYGESATLKPDQERPGDLVFSEFDSSGPGHVMIVWDPEAGTVIEAPHTGDVVKFLHYKTLPGVRFGRLKASAFAR